MRLFMFSFSSGDFTIASGTKYMHHGTEGEVLMIEEAEIVKSNAMMQNTSWILEEIGRNDRQKITTNCFNLNVFNHVFF